MNTEPITGFQGAYRFLSNFFESPFDAPIDGETVHFTWNEQFFMLHKSFDFEYRFAVMWAKTPGECKRLGKTCELRSDWETVKVPVMVEGLRYKFAQNPELAAALYETGHKYLEETNTWGDQFWGVSTEGIGRNMLGISLMQVRAELSVKGALEAYK